MNKKRGRITTTIIVLSLLLVIGCAAYLRAEQYAQYRFLQRCQDDDSVSAFDCREGYRHAKKEYYILPKPWVIFEKGYWTAE